MLHCIDTAKDDCTWKDERWGLDRRYKIGTLSYINTGKIETESPAMCNTLSSKLVNDIGVVHIHILAPTDPHNSFHLTHTSGGIPKLLCNYFRAYKDVNVNIE